MKIDPKNYRQEDIHKFKRYLTYFNRVAGTSYSIKMGKHRKKWTLFNEIGEFFGPSGGLATLGHNIGNVFVGIENKVEGFIHDLHEDVKSILSVPHEVIQNAPTILNSAGTAVSTASQGIGSGIGTIGQSFTLPLIAAAAVGNLSDNDKIINQL